MEARTIVHFGGGALGRGLVIPILIDSGYDVVLVDNNTALAQELKKTNTYPLDVSDAEPEKRGQTIQLKAVVDSRDKRMVFQWLCKAEAITTSVLRENLIHVARTLAEALETQKRFPRKIICCENVEKVGTFFVGLLSENIKASCMERIAALNIPDVVVDRICAANFPETLCVTSERFFECSVDAGVLADTGIAHISSIQNLRGAFDRKRFLMNTYADAISFLALARGKRYLYEAAADETINMDVAPYLAMLKRLLMLEHGYASEEIEGWADCYRLRLSNLNIPRPLQTVARNFWKKMTLQERFIFPIIQLMQRGEDVRGAMPLLAQLLRAGDSLTRETSADEITGHLRALWSGHPYGEHLLQEILKSF